MDKWGGGWTNQSTLVGVNDRLPLPDDGRRPLLDKGRLPLLEDGLPESVDELDSERLRDVVAFWRVGSLLDLGTVSENESVDARGT